MKFKDVEERVRGIPFISRSDAKYLYNLILDEDISDILELGIAHGTATCYMAAALEERGGGSITAVDLSERAAHYQPSAEEQLAKHGFESLVTIARMQTGYTWFLHDAIRAATTDGHCEPCYDLCIIDGPKNWTIDGAAFFMADKLLRKDGWLVFDDYDWSYGRADESREATDGITHRALSEDERRMPQIKEVFELLVQQHPDYSNFKVINENWAIAQKTRSGVSETTYVDKHRDLEGGPANRAFRKLRRAAKQSIRSARGTRRKAP
ncbi:MAG: class I SAM-dependent methyltransferase [Pseudomonadota bacterium]